MSFIANSAVSLVMLAAVTGSQVTKDNSNISPAPAQQKSSLAASKSTAKTTANHASAKPTSPPEPVLVSVQAGDTLSSIAATNNTTFTRLFDANLDISDPNVITVGQQVRVPDPSEQLAERALPVAPVASVASAPAPVKSVAAAATNYTASYAVSGNDAKAFIYAHESGNNPNSTSPNGCYGLGQDCNGVVRNQCGADYACQDAYFSNYAANRYGGWEGAAAFWQANGWW